MEGTGLVAAARPIQHTMDHSEDDSAFTIDDPDNIVKGICDWGEERKTKTRQTISGLPQRTLPRSCSTW